ncbi:hypothetical protein PV721_17735 [Streptomyces sp. MB09-01]|uniref:hypothetical protein n=1 Tax=Streptomyces sp. MB09-01 TaxID=3028666 RepID=UPI0029BEDA6D|nr:hypothetical protein [Streptomyces sp. MB09-01]MDX3536181.1 hypothetical protein [Streptomyces sp. MB09-01]
MGGLQCVRPGRRGRSGLRRALLLAVFGALAGVLTGALFLCASRSGESPVSHGSARAGAQAEPRAHGTTHATTHAVCVSPYDLPGCSSLAHVTPGVLPVPPPAVTVPDGEPPPAAEASGAGRIRPPGPLARAPDLHALQVLRT